MLILLALLFETLAYFLDMTRLYLFFLTVNQTKHNY